MAGGTQADARRQRLIREDVVRLSVEEEEEVGGGSFLCSSLSQGAGGSRGDVDVVSHVQRRRTRSRFVEACQAVSAGASGAQETAERVDAEDVQVGHSARPESVGRGAICSYSSRRRVPYASRLYPRSIV